MPSRITLGSWNTRVTVTTAEDIGRLTADILFTHPAGTNQIFFTAGVASFLRRRAAAA